MHAGSAASKTSSSTLERTVSTLIIIALIIDGYGIYDVYDMCDLDIYIHYHSLREYLDLSTVYVLHSTTIPTTRDHDDKGLSKVCTQGKEEANEAVRRQVHLCTQI